MEMKSKYLPTGCHTNSRITLIAGRGHYPELTRLRATSAGIPLSLLQLEGETREDLCEKFAPDEMRTVKVGQIGKLLKSLKALRTTHVVMIGQIQPGRLFKGLHPDLRAIKILASLKEKNAATIFGAIVREIESIGVEILDARAFLDNDLADPGLMTRGKQKADSDYLAHGIRIAREVARLHIGQGVVVRKGTVLAVEAFEGTDEMLKRGGSFKTDQKIFVKIPHPDHDYRFDVPVFGLQTLQSMIEAGIGTAALAAGKTVILDKEEVLQKANKEGVELIGFTQSDD